MNDEPPGDGAFEVAIPRDARGFPELAVECPTFPPCAPCAPVDAPELASQLTKVFESRIKGLLDAGLRAPTLPGRLDPLVWFVEDVIGLANGFGLPEDVVYECAEKTFPEWSRFLIDSALVKLSKGSFYAPNTKSNAVASARAAKDEARRAAREAMALNREIVARKVTDATPAKLGCHVVRWLVSGDRSAHVMTGPANSALATPFLLRGGLDCADGTTLFAVAPVQSAGLAIKGKVAGVDWELVGANEVLPGEFTGVQWAQAQAANKQLPAGLWSAIVQARKASTDLKAMAPEGGLDENTLTGRAAISLGIERLRMMKAANVNLFSGGTGPGDQSLAQLHSTVEWLARGLNLNVLVTRDILLEGQFGDAKPRNYGDVSDWFVRMVLQKRAEGSYLSPGECLPQVSDDASVTSSGDAFQDVLAPLCAGRDEVLKSDVELALRAAGVANVVTNIFSGRCTRTLARLGFEKKTLVDAAGNAQRGYRRLGTPAPVAPVVGEPKIERGTFAWYGVRQARALDALEGDES